MEKSDGPFYLEDIHWKPNIHGKVVCMVVSHRILTVATESGRILRWSWDSSEVTELEFLRPDAVPRLFQDYQGWHLIIALDSGENYYVPAGKMKPKALAGTRGVRIESIAFPPATTAESTGEFLIGTNAGAVLRACIEKEKEKFVKSAFELMENSPICGLQLQQFASQDRYFIMIATPSRYYQLVGGPTLEAAFLAYQGSPPPFVDQQSELDYSSLTFFRKEPNAVALSFAWMTGNGIVNGRLNFTNQQFGGRCVVKPKTLYYPAALGEEATGNAQPLGLEISEFHFLSLHRDRLHIINALSEEVVFEKIFDYRNHGIPRGVARDELVNTYWVYTDESIFEVVIQNEDADIWRCYLEKGQYELALHYCRDNVQKDTVLSAKADELYQKGELTEAATAYAKTNRGLEEIALKFYLAEQRQPLRTYLLAKLDTLKAHESTQATLISMWLIDIYLNELNLLPPILEVDLPKEESSRDPTPYELIRDEFFRFLYDWRDCLNPAATYGLIKQHGRMDVYLYYCEVNEDWARLAEKHIHRGEWQQALEALDRDPAEHAEAYYRLIPIIIRNIPVNVTNSLIYKASNLETHRLLPALMAYDIKYNPPGNKSHQAIRMLQRATRDLRVEEAAVYNYLLNLIIFQMPNEEGSKNEPLMKFLGTPGMEERVDLQYALRLCKEIGRKDGVIQIYTMMKEYEEAVTLALHNSQIELAAQNAEKPDDEMERRRLWYKIAQYLIQEQKNIKKCVQLIATSETLRIDDVLNFLDDSVLLTTFRQELIHALENYHRNINDLKRGMEEATQSADLIRKDIKLLRGRSSKIAGNCKICSAAILTKAFYRFQCSHTFHMDCLRKEISRHLSPKDRARLEELTKILQQKGDGNLSSVFLSTDDTNEAEAFRAELDELVAGECILCGDMMVNMVSKPFIGEEESAQLSTWAIDKRFQYKAETNTNTNTNIPHASSLPQAT